MSNGYAHMIEEYKDSRDALRGRIRQLNRLLEAGSDTGAMHDLRRRRQLLYAEMAEMEWAMNQMMRHMANADIHSDKPADMRKIKAFE